MKKYTLIIAGVSGYLAVCIALFGLIINWFNPYVAFFLSFIIPAVVLWTFKDWLFNE